MATALPLILLFLLFTTQTLTIPWYQSCSPAQIHSAFITRHHQSNQTMYDSTNQQTNWEVELSCAPKMATALILFLLFTIQTLKSHNPTSPHISSHTFYSNHHKMLQSFKIYIYPNPQNLHIPTTFKHQSESAFYTTLLNSSFLTSNPDEAHLFFIPIPLSTFSSRSIYRLIRDIRSTYPYWNRTLGADHFYLHCQGLSYQSDRNLVELKKNAVQISCFPTKHTHYIPHKDITLPPFDSTLTHLVNADPETSGGRLKYCLMSYDDGSVGMVGEALRKGCVPVVVLGSGGGTGQDLPLLELVKWGEMGVFVGGGVSGSTEELRRVLRKVESGGGYEKMRELGAAAARHFVWGSGDDRYDAFHSVMYELWVRRHTIRYARVHV